MIQLALAAALLLQVPDTVRVFDSPQTEALVLRAIQALGQVPADLADYRAEVQTTMQISIAADTTGVADLPATVDELVSNVRWERRGYLHQEVIGHRTRMVVPLPYTLASIYETVWVIPHLYGIRIYTPLGGRSAINPFGASGPRFYRYEAQDTVRIRLPDETLTLVPIAVRPRTASTEENQLLVGTFYLDESRAAVARARLAFSGGERLFPASFGQVQTFLELENALWEGRYWLPYRQRRDILFESRLLGGAVTARVVNRFTDLETNTGWMPGGDLVRLEWNLGDRAAAFAGWEAPLGDEESELAIADFADLRLAASAEAAARSGLQAQLHFERGSHLFRYNRVEGPFVGLGGRIVPPNPTQNRWELYGTAGWAFAEQTPRGEISLRTGVAVTPRPDAVTDWGFEATGYRQLRDIQPFRPTFVWDWLYTLPAVLWGSDPRDYYDAMGGAVSALAERGRWSGRGTVRYERHDSVSVNTQRFLFGTADEFDLLAGTDPGGILSLEGGAQYSLGPGAFGIGNSLLTRLEGETGFGDFRYNRAVALLSLRYSLGPVTLAARGDGGHAWGEVPAQLLFRFGSIEGLRGYEENEFGGSTALLGRGRFLIGLPPRSAQPLARAGLFLIPPLRPSLVLLGETGWTAIEGELSPALLRLGARPTDGFRSSVGLGLSIFDDAVTLERLFPLDDDDGEPRWYVGLTYWY
ncbi:MAG: hypothetical protein WD766_04425 [Gemmatimonadota bacterium]